jgi:hypothetical protein
VAPKNSFVIKKAKQFNMKEEGTEPAGMILRKNRASLKTIKFVCTEHFLSDKLDRFLRLESSIVACNLSGAL